MAKFKYYLCSLDYFATGEGSTTAVMAVPARDKKEAVDQFLRKAMLKDLTDEVHIKEAVAYFSPCTKVFSLRNKADQKKIKAILSSLLDPKVVEYLLDASKGHALHDFSFKSYVNYC